MTLLNSEFYDTLESTELAVSTIKTVLLSLVGALHGDNGLFRQERVNLGGGPVRSMGEEGSLEGPEADAPERLTVPEDVGRPLTGERLSLIHI